MLTPEERRYQAFFFLTCFTCFIVLRSAGLCTSGVFNAQDVANTLWALATMKMVAKEDQIVALLRLLEGRAEVISGSEFTCFTRTNVRFSVCLLY